MSPILSKRLEVWVLVISQERRSFLRREVAIDTHDTRVNMSQTEVALYYLFYYYYFSWHLVRAKTFRHNFYLCGAKFQLIASSQLSPISDNCSINCNTQIETHEMRQCQTVQPLRSGAGRLAVVLCGPNRPTTSGLPHSVVLVLWLRQPRSFGYLCAAKEREREILGIYNPLCVFCSSSVIIIWGWCCYRGQFANIR